MRVHSQLATIGLCALAAACGDDARSGTAHGDGGAGGSDGGRDSRPALTGTVVDAEGRPVEGTVRMCASACFLARIDLEGSYAFPRLFDEDYVLEVVARSDDFAVPVTTRAWREGDVDRIDVTVPALEIATDLPVEAREVTLATGFHAVVGDDLVERAATGVPTHPLGGVRVPESMWLPIELEGVVLAVWYLMPWDARATEGGLAFRIDNAWGTDRELSLRTAFWDVDAAAGRWESAGALAVTAESIEGDGLRHLTVAVLIATTR